MCAQVVKDDAAKITERDVSFAKHIPQKSNIANIFVQYNMLARSELLIWSLWLQVDKEIATYICVCVCFDISLLFLKPWKETK